MQPAKHGGPARRLRHRAARWCTVLCAAIAVTLTAAPPLAEAQFDPSGRRKPRGGGSTKPRGKPKPAGTAPKPRDKGKGPSSEELIKRYTQIVLSQPEQTFPLQRLAQLIRERDGKLDALIAEFERRVAEDTKTHRAALIALAGLYRQDGRFDLAIATYEKAIGEQPSDPAPQLALAHLYEDRGDKAQAYARYQQALPLIKGDAEREQVLRTAMGLAIDAKDLDAAKRYHAELVKRAKGSFYVQAELARELFVRGETDAAVSEYRKVVEAAAGDHRVLAPALRDLGRALNKQGKPDEARATLEKALGIAGGQAGVRREIYEILAEVYRAQDRLPELVTKLETHPSGDRAELLLLGSLYEETGKVEQALTAYRRALGKDGKDIETRLKVVRLLQLSGKIEEAVVEYQSLVRAAPSNPDFVFQLVEALIARGDRATALAELGKLEQRSRSDEDTAAALVSAYERLGEPERALALLKKLGEGARDPQHLVDLGERYWQAGDKAKALATWQRIKAIVADAARGAHALGEVLIDHEMAKEGLEELARAQKLKPEARKYRRAYAAALERTSYNAPDALRLERIAQALVAWQALLADAGSDASAAREARQHVIALWGLSGSLDTRAAPLERQLAATPPDLDAGRMLAELYARLRRPGDSERVLRRVTDAAPGDVASLAELERALAQQKKLAEAITVIERLIQADPQRARELYQRAAQYSAELYRDDDAVRYAARAVELAPDDAEGHRRLGAMYRRRQDRSRAIAELRLAISKNDRLFPVYLELAELLVTDGALDEADRLLRRVVRSSPDEELVAQALRAAMQINLGRGTLESLEKELLPVALANPARPLYRRLLVEIYGAMAFPLVQELHGSDAAKASAARVTLTRLGERAVKPLLDALTDDRDAQQRTAVELLGYVQNRGASLALLTFATGTAELGLRVRALLAIGRLRDPAIVPKLAELVAPGGVARTDDGDPLLVAAAWSLAWSRAPQARAACAALARTETASLRGLGAIGLGLLRDRASLTLLRDLAGAGEASPVARASAAWALGALGDRSAIDSVSALTSASDGTLAATALVALGRLDRARADAALAEAVFAVDARVRAAAATSVNETDVALGEPEARVEVRVLLDEAAAHGAPAALRAAALGRVGDDLARSARAALHGSPERVAVVTDALCGAPSALPPLASADDSLPDDARARVTAVRDRVALAAVPSLLELASHPLPELRARVLGCLGASAAPDARAALVAALRDGDAHVVEVAEAALVPGDLAAAEAPLAAALADASSTWSARRDAARTLGRIGQGTASAAALRALSTAAERDAYALVREASVLALVSIDPRGSTTRATLGRIAAHDAEPRVRETARQGERP